MPQIYPLEQSIRLCHDMLRGAKKIIITTHVNPDGDAIGSTLGLYHFLNQAGVEATIISHSPVAHNFFFLSGAEDIQLYNAELHDEKILSADVFFLLDANSLQRIESMRPVWERFTGRKIVVDHHLNPERIADLFVVDTDACSTAELVWKIIHHSEEEHWTPQIAQALYTGILTDTGSFNYPKTDAEVHWIAAQLIQTGADPSYVHNQVFNSSSLERTLLLGEGLARLELHYDGRLCLMTIPRELYERTGASEEDLEGFVNFTLSIHGVAMGILLAEKQSETKVKLSFRSKGSTPVNSLAAEFGGGGHFNAAGGRIANVTIDEARLMVLGRAGRFLNAEG